MYRVVVWMISGDEPTLLKELYIESFLDAEKLCLIGNTASEKANLHSLENYGYGFSILFKIVDFKQKDDISTSLSTVLEEFCETSDFYFMKKYMTI